MLDTIDMTNANLASDNLGEMWDDFAVRCTPGVAIQLADAYNLITLSLEAGNEGNNGFLDVEITNILIDEARETSDTIQAIRRLLIDGVVDCLQAMGIIIDMDYIGPDELGVLCKVLDTIFTFDGMEDILGLADVLDDEGIDPKERFITVIKMNDPQTDFENLYDIISEVSMDVTKGLLIGLNILATDDDQYMEPAMKRRLKGNKEFFKGTLGEFHVVNGGGIQQQQEVYLTLFAAELGEMLLTDPVAYVKNVLSLLLLTSLTRSQIEGQIMALTQDVSSDLEVMYRCQAVFKEVNFNE